MYFWLFYMLFQFVNFAEQLTDTCIFERDDNYEDSQSKSKFWIFEICLTNFLLSIHVICFNFFKNLLKIFPSFIENVLTIYQIFFSKIPRNWYKKKTKIRNILSSHFSNIYINFTKLYHGFSSLKKIWNFSKIFRNFLRC